MTWMSIRAPDCERRMRFATWCVSIAARMWISRAGTLDESSSHASALSEGQSSQRGSVGAIGRLSRDETRVSGSPTPPPRSSRRRRASGIDLRSWIAAEHRRREMRRQQPRAAYVRGRDRPIAWARSVFAVLVAQMRGRAGSRPSVWQSMDVGDVTRHPVDRQSAMLAAPPAEGWREAERGAVVDRYIQDSGSRI